MLVAQAKSKSAVGAGWSGGGCFGSPKCPGMRRMGPVSVRKAAKCLGSQLQIAQEGATACIKEVARTIKGTGACSIGRKSHAPRSSARPVWRLATQADVLDHRLDFDAIVRAPFAQDAFGLLLDRDTELAIEEHGTGEV